MALETGTSLAGYRITGILGQGGMGVVYEALQVSLNRTVALKVLAPHLSDDLSFRERFRREGQIQAGIDHEHIVTVYEAGQSEHGFFIAMRLIRGPNLKDMIVSRELDAGRTLRILGPIGGALDTAHEAGLIHRDIKPQNILVGGRDQAFLADFGLTKATGEQSLTRTGQFVGTFDYISPEQIKGERASAKSDVYALAAVLYECLTGVVPYPKDSEAAVLYAHMADPPPRLTEQRPELPASLDEVIAAGMAKDPADRHASAGELLLEINRTFTRRTRAAFTPPGPIETPQETGIRSAEGDVDTRAAEHPHLAPTEQGALEPDTEVPISPGETLRAEAPPAETAPPTETPPAETAPPTETPPPAPDVTVPSAAPPPPTEPPTPEPAPTTASAAPSPAETRLGPERTAQPTKEGEPEVGPPQSRGRPRGETPATAVLPDVGTGTRARAEQPPTRLGGAPPDAAAARTGTPPRLPARRASSPVLAAVAVGLLALLAAAGFFLGRSGGDSEESSPAASSSATKGALELGFPNDWERADSGPEIPGLKLGDTIVLSPKSGPRADGLLAGATGATGPALLPTSFLSRLPEEPARDDPVKLGSLEAYRYQDLRPEGYEGRLTVYVAPTSAGVATVACASSVAGAEAFLPDCEEVAGNLKLVGGQAFPLGPDEKYLTALGKAMDKLNSGRKRDTAKLRKARKRAGQADAAGALAADYRRARKSLEGLSVNPAALDAAAQVRAALSKSERAYEDLAKAASRGKKSAYNAATRDVQAGEKALKQALTAVNAASA